MTGKSLSKATAGERFEAYEYLDTSRGVQFFQNVTETRCVGHPFDQAAFFVQWNYGVRPNICKPIRLSCAHLGILRPTKPSSTRFRVCLQKLVYDGVEVHQPGVLPEVVFGFAEEIVRRTVAS